MHRGRVVYNLIAQRIGVSRSSTERVNRFLVAASWTQAHGLRTWYEPEAPAFAYYLLQWDELVAFDALRFDAHTLASYIAPVYRAEIYTLQHKTVDLWDLIRRRSGLRVSLNQVASDTLGWGTLEHPDRLNNPAQLERYCVRNTALIRGLDDFRRAFGFVYVGDLLVSLESDALRHNDAA